MKCSRGLMKCSQTQNCISPKGRFSKDTLMESICFVLQVRFFLATMYACSKQGREIHPLSTTLSNSNTHTHTHTHERYEPCVGDKSTQCQAGSDKKEGTV